MVRNRNKSIVLVCLLSLILCLGVVGCDPASTPASRVASAKVVVDKANNLNAQVDASVAELQGVVQTSQLLLLDPNIPESSKPAIAQALQTASAKITTLQVQKAKITAALIQWQAILNQTAAEGNNVDLTSEIQTYVAMAQSSASFLPPPYNGYVYLGSSLAAVLAGLIASVIKNSKQSGQINDAKAKLTDLVSSVDVLLDPTQNNGVIPATQVAAAKIVLQQNQVGATQDLVDAIHDPMQNTAPTK